MSSVNQSPIGPATAGKRGTQSAAHFTKLEDLPANAALEARLLAIESAPPAAVETVTQANGLTLTAGDLALAAAGAAQAGAVTTGAQEFGGVKTLTGALLAGVTTITEAVVALVRAVGVSLVLRSSLGAGASDKCVVVGSSEDDGAVNAAARLQEWQTGIGGATPVTKAYVRKDGSLLVVRSGGFIAFGSYDGAQEGFLYRVATGELGLSNANGAAGLFFALGNGVSRCTGAFNIGSTSQLNTVGTARPVASSTTRGTLWYSKSAGGAADTVEICLKSAADTYSWVVISTG